MRIKKVLFILTLFLILIPSIKAEKAQEVLTCVYKKGKNEITVKMDTEYKFDVTTNFLATEKKCTGNNYSPTCVNPVSNNLMYNEFLNEQNKFYCPEEIYINERIQSVASSNSASNTTTYIVSRKKQLKTETESNAQPGGRGGSSTKYIESVVYNVDKNKSSISIVSPGGVNEEEGWLKTCNYGDIILRFNKNEYEYTSTGNYKTTGITNDLMELLKINQYTCPVSLCVNTYRGYSSFSYYFDNSKLTEDDCIVASEYTDSKYKCVGVDQYYSEFIKYHNKYQTTKSIQYITSRNEAEDRIKVFCNSALSKLGYNDSNNCVKDCIDVQKDIQSKLGLDSTGECGFSDKLLIWIRNIIKWVKYIIPAIVIILGILDFIKAMASSNDDEFKKAQQRFIKRLIAAALLFIVPFIIEFALRTFNIGDDNPFCGVLSEKAKDS